MNRGNLIIANRTCFDCVINVQLVLIPSTPEIFDLSNICKIYFSNRCSPRLRSKFYSSSAKIATPREFAISYLTLRGNGVRMYVPGNKEEVGMLYSCNGNFKSMRHSKQRSRKFLSSEGNNQKEIAKFIKILLKYKF